MIPNRIDISTQVGPGHPDWWTFLAVLQQLRPWRLRMGVIESDRYHGHSCVWDTAVGHDYGRWFPGWWDKVWSANDNAPGHDPTTRRALLRACGLEGHR